MSLLQRVVTLDTWLRILLAVIRWCVVAACAYWVLDVIVGGSDLVSMNDQDLVAGTGGARTVSVPLAFYIAGVFIVITWIASWLVKGVWFLITMVLSPVALNAITTQEAEQL